MPAKRPSVITVDSFFRSAPAMRSHFEERFRDPRSTRSDRFVWDYWHVPGQYTALRTTPYHFFPKKLYEAFHRELVLWGRRTLGCHDISPPWMSCYVEGCKQEMHGDLPHGPWAYVFSLTPWKTRKFRGGETILLRDEILSYWQDFTSSRSLEEGNILRSVPSLFNRLTVFDPRIPHGVREVRGVQDVLEGRLVIHGWFVQPRPFIEGSLPPSALQTVLEGLGEELGALFDAGVAVQGTLSLRFQVTQKGEIKQIRYLTNSVRSLQGADEAEARVGRVIRAFLSRVSFGRQRGISFVTVPFVFES